MRLQKEQEQCWTQQVSGSSQIFSIPLFKKWMDIKVEKIEGKNVFAIVCLGVCLPVKKELI